MNREGKKCVIYVRVSTEMQVDGFSLDAQKNTLKRFAEREGMIIKEIYEDAGKSGKSIEGRPAFRKLLNDIENGLEIDFVLVYKLSRFGRNAADILTSLELIQSYDINLIATEEGIDSSQTSGKLLISVLSAVSEIERENILEQTMNGRKEKARQGGWNGGFAPYGYTLVNGELVINPEEAEAVLFIFDTYVNTEKGMGGIVKELNLQGIEKLSRPNQSVKRWSLGNVKTILRNPIYYGKMPYGRRTKRKVKGSKSRYSTIRATDYICEDGKHTPIITEEVWKRAQEKQDSAAYEYEKHAGRHRVHLLTGLLKCPICGGPMLTTKSNYRKNGEDYSLFYYRCYSTVRVSQRECTYTKQIRKEMIEPYVVELVNILVNDEEFAKALKDQIVSKDRAENIEKELARYKANLKDVMLSKEKLENTIDTLPAETKHYDMILADLNQRLYKQYDLIGEIQDKIADAEIRLSEASSSASNYNNIMTLISNFNKIYSVANEEEKKMLLKLIFNKIEIYDDFKEGRILKSVDLNFKLYNKSVEMTEMIVEVDDEKKHKTPELLFHVEITEEMQIKIYNQIKEKNLMIRKKERVVKKPYNHSEEYIEKHTLKKESNEVIEMPPKVTYKKIKEYIMEKYGLNAHSSYIAEVKRKHGIEMINTRSKEGAKVHHPTEQMTEAIEDALRYFNMI